MEEQKIKLEIQDTAVNRIAKESIDPEYGARPIKRTIRYLLENPLSTKILSGEVRSGNLVTISSGEIGGLVFNVKN
jgi:ATP-dependent Clp protease ATP-binding subunit ClpA